MQECVLLLPNILRLLPELRILLRSLQALRSTGSVIINWLDHGPDILLRMDADFTGPDRTKIIAFARTHKILRISIATGTDLPEPAIILAPPIITFAGIPVEPPPGGFLQPSGEGESAIITAVLAALPKLTAKSRLVELYAGSGTLSFALAQHARVEAYEGDASAVAAQDKAIRTNNLAGRMRITHRDLHRRPLQPTDMSGAAAVILDPPYSGATTQTKFIAASAVKKIIYISCNPEALTNRRYSAPPRRLHPHQRNPHRPIPLFRKHRKRHHLLKVGWVSAAQPIIPSPPETSPPPSGTSPFPPHSTG